MDSTLRWTGGILAATAVAFTTGISSIVEEWVNGAAPPPEVTRFISIIGSEASKIKNFDIVDRPLDYMIARTRETVPDSIGDAFINATHQQMSSLVCVDLLNGPPEWFFTENNIAGTLYILAQRFTAYAQFFRTWSHNEATMLMIGICLLSMLLAGLLAWLAIVFVKNRFELVLAARESRWRRATPFPGSSNNNSGDDDDDDDDDDDEDSDKNDNSSGNGTNLHVDDGSDQTKKVDKPSQQSASTQTGDSDEKSPQLSDKEASLKACEASLRACQDELQATKERLENRVRQAEPASTIANAENERLQRDLDAQRETERALATENARLSDLLQSHTLRHRRQEETQATLQAEVLHLRNDLQVSKTLSHSLDQDVQQYLDSERQMQDRERAASQREGTLQRRSQDLERRSTAAERTESRLQSLAQQLEQRRVEISQQGNHARDQALRLEQQEERLREMERALKQRESSIRGQELSHARKIRQQSSSATATAATMLESASTTPDVQEARGTDEPRPEETPTEDKSKIACRFWLGSKGCMNGQDCLYFHADSAMVGPNVQPEQGPSTTGLPGHKSSHSSNTVEEVAEEVKGAEQSEQRASSADAAEAEPEVDRSKVPCRFWGTQESCTRGRKCRYSHAHAHAPGPKEKIEEEDYTKAEPVKAQKACKFWSTKRGCRSGRECPYLHIAEPGPKDNPRDRFHLPREEEEEALGESNEDGPPTTEKSPAGPSRQPQRLRTSSDLTSSMHARNQIEDASTAEPKKASSEKGKSPAPPSLPTSGQSEGFTETWSGGLATSRHAPAQSLVQESRASGTSAHPRAPEASAPGPSRQAAGPSLKQGISRPGPVREDSDKRSSCPSINESPTEEASGPFRVNPQAHGLAASRHAGADPEPQQKSSGQGPGGSSYATEDQEPMSPLEASSSKPRSSATKTIATSSEAPESQAEPKATGESTSSQDIARPWQSGMLMVSRYARVEPESSRDAGRNEPPPHSTSSSRPRQRAGLNDSRYAIPATEASASAAATSTRRRGGTLAESRYALDTLEQRGSEVSLKPSTRRWTELDQEGSGDKGGGG